MVLLLCLTVNNFGELFPLFFPVLSGFVLRAGPADGEPALGVFIKLGGGRRRRGAEVYGASALRLI